MARRGYRLVLQAGPRRRSLRRAWEREAGTVSEGGRFQGGNAFGTVLIAIPIVSFCPLIYAVNRLLSWCGVTLPDAAGW